MNGDCERYPRIVRRFGSATEFSVPFRTGRPKPVEPTRRWTLGLAMYCRNCAHAGCGAFHEHEKPSPPPSIEPGSALLPGMFGNGNQLRKLGTLPSGVRPCATPASQCPCSSMATLPFASRPAELDAPVWAGVARKPSLNGFASSSFCRVTPAWTQHGSLKLCVTIVFWTTALLQVFTASVSQ